MVYPRTTPEAADVVHDDLSPVHYGVFGMYTKAEYRGQGIGKALLAAAVRLGGEHASRLGRPFVGTLMTDTVNAAAQGLYRAAGFVPIKTVTFTLRGRERTGTVFQYDSRNNIA